MDFIYFVAGFFLFLHAWRRGHVYAALRRVEMLPDERAIISDADFTEFERGMLTEPGDELTALGFVLSHCERGASCENGVVCRINQRIYKHSQLHSWATLAGTLSPSGGQGYFVWFSTLFSDGFQIGTTNIPGAVTFPDTARGATARCYSEKIGAIWETHVARVADNRAAHGAEVPVPSSNDLFEREYQRLIETLRAHPSKFEAHEGNRYRATRMHAFRSAGRLIAESQKAARANPKRSDTPVKEAPVDAEIAAYKQLSAIREGQVVQRAAKWLLFVITAVLFMLSFGLTLSWSAVTILLLVILFHELGHAAAMRWFGFKDLKILFLPFLGAVAIGKQRNIPTYQRVVVALAGPLPGLILGLLGSVLMETGAVPHSDLLHEIVWTLILINFSNLLPIMPLDGGQVLHALLFSRFPILEAAFTILGAFLLGVIGWFAQAPVLCFVGLLLLVTTKEQMRRTRMLISLRRKLRERESDDDEGALLALVFGHLSANGLVRQPFHQRFQVAEYLMTNVRAPVAGALQTAFLILLYSFSLALLPLVLIGTGIARAGESPNVLHGVVSESDESLREPHRPGLGAPDPIQVDDLLSV